MESAQSEQKNLFLVIFQVSWLGTLICKKKQYTALVLKSGFFNHKIINTCSFIKALNIKIYKGNKSSLLGVNHVYTSTFSVVY